MMWAPGLQGQEPDSSTKAPSIQEQLDQLLQNQQRILQELDSIKSRLPEAPGRTEYGAKPPAATNLISLNVHGEFFRGDPKARVVMMVYSDFACSFCARF